MDDIDERLNRLSKKSEGIMAGLGEGFDLTLLVSKRALEEESRLIFKVVADVPHDMTPEEARKMGWAMYVLGKNAEEASDPAGGADNPGFFEG